MTTITRKIEWDMAHRLGDGYQSKCKYLHGHRYTAEITCSAPTLNKFGMVIDLGDIKNLCKGWIDEHLDHGTMVYVDDTSLVDWLIIQKQKYYPIPFNTTVENIVDLLAVVFSQQLERVSALRARGVKLVKLRVYETPNGWAEWRADADTR